MRNPALSEAELVMAAGDWAGTFRREGDRPGENAAIQGALNQHGGSEQPWIVKQMGHLRDRLEEL